MPRTTVPAAPVNSSNRKPALKQAELAMQFQRISEQKLAITLAYRIARVLVGHPPNVVRQALTMCEPEAAALTPLAPANDAAMDH
jgi:hypothetical protein